MRVLFVVVAVATFLCFVMAVVTYTEDAHDSRACERASGVLVGSGGRAACIDRHAVITP